MSLLHLSARALRRPPPIWREARYFAERASLRSDPIFTGEGVPHGRGRPVLLIPGYLSGDLTLALLAGWLRRAGYRAGHTGMRLNVDCGEAAQGVGKAEDGGDCGVDVVDFLGGQCDAVRLDALRDDLGAERAGLGGVGHGHGGARPRVVQGGDEARSRVTRLRRSARSRRRPPAGSAPRRTRCARGRRPRRRRPAPSVRCSRW